MSTHRPVAAPADPPVGGEGADTWVELTGVAVTRGGRRLLAPFDLRLSHGMWLGVVGPNGAGKTTLLRAIAGLVPHEGSVQVDGHDLARVRGARRARQIAVVPQHPTIPEGTTVREYVLLGRTPHVGWLGRERPTDHAVVDAALVRLDLTELAHRDLASLSGGERQRAVIGRALTQEAPLLLLDEPTTALDIGHQQQVLELVDELRHERGLTVISAMHDLTLAAQHADRFVLLDRGEVVAVGPPAEVFEPDTLQRVFGATISVVRDGDDLVVIPRRRGRPPST
jgi:cobalamin transport system ATP-binding protein